MRSQLFIPWLALASLVTAQVTQFTDDLPEELLAARNDLVDEGDSSQELFDDQEIDTTLDGYDHESVAGDLRADGKAKRAPLAIRDMLADEAINMIHEYGQGVDVSLDGYDHDAVARDVEEGPLENVERGLGFEAARRLGRMKPHYVLHNARDDDEEEEVGDDEEDTGPWVDLDPYDEGDVGKRADEDYDEGDGLDDNGDTPVVSLERDADGEPADASDEVDYSLEGYDHSLLGRNSDYDYYDPDVAFRDEACDTVDAELGSEGRFEQRDADEHERVLQKGPPMQRRRDLVHEDLDEEDDGALANAWSTVRRWIDDMVNV